MTNSSKNKYVLISFLFGFGLIELINTVYFVIEFSELTEIQYFLVIFCAIQGIVFISGGFYIRQHRSRKAQQDPSQSSSNQTLIQSPPKPIHSQKEKRMVGIFLIFIGCIFFGVMILRIIALNLSPSSQFLAYCAIFPVSLLLFYLGFVLFRE